jgi:hypothetical protein
MGGLCVQSMPAMLAGLVAHGVSQARDYSKAGLPRFGSLAVSKPQDW